MVWDSTTFNIYNLQLTTPVLPVHVMLEKQNKQDIEDTCVVLTRVSALTSGKFCDDADDWEITKNKRWINWRPSPRSSWNFGFQRCPVTSRFPGKISGRC